MHQLKQLTEERKKGRITGICSICSSNLYVIRAGLIQAKRTGTAVLIEATANQVNQDGGYTGMKPADYREYVYREAEEIGLPKERIILGGDHLGPVAWKNLPGKKAMEKARVLVREFAAAGYSKIHLDASMPLGEEVTLTTEEIADRTVILAKEAEEGFNQWKKEHPEAKSPVYIIGSEVPTPGGSGEEDELSVTKPEALSDMLNCFEKKFKEAELKEVWENIIGAVVQPGVEFGNDNVHEYSPEDAKELISRAKDFSEIVLEGHSTDYQPEHCLREMVEDGIAILKVGPALTFAAREGLFALAFMEKELKCEEPSDFMEVLDKAMTDNPGNWISHYTSEEPHSTFMRKYSLSDRSRYYMNVAEVMEAEEKLISNLSGKEIPLSLISQFAPAQYQKIREGLIENSPEDIVTDKVCDVLSQYWRACGLSGKREDI